MSNCLDIKVPTSHCCECGKKLDGCCGESVRPSSGDMAICFYCASLNVFADDMTLRRPTDDEYIQSTKFHGLQELRKKILAFLKDS